LSPSDHADLLHPDPDRRLDAGRDVLGLDRQLGEPLRAYLALLVQWNRSYNLTAIRDPAEMVTKHLLDSLVLAPYFESECIADLGTGPGLPGIPLALARPGISVSLVESNGKKCRFMRQAVRALGLSDRVEVAESRAEGLELPGRFDCLVARALGTLEMILTVGGHLLRPNGRLLAMKGQRPDAEIAELPEPWKVLAVEALSVPGLDAERHLIQIGRSDAAHGD